MFISWPARIADASLMRRQFHYAIDILPTILEVFGVSQPTTVNGVPQKPIEGVSLAYTFAKEQADAPSRRYTQYFEMFGNRALYHDGWIACCRHGRLPWISVGSAPSPSMPRYPPRGQKECRSAWAATRWAGRHSCRTASSSTTTTVQHGAVRGAIQPARTVRQGRAALRICQ
jgi:arylsulfatase A-like enzyme